MCVYMLNLIFWRFTSTQVLQLWSTHLYILGAVKTHLGPQDLLTPSSETVKLEPTGVKEITPCYLSRHITTLMTSLRLPGKSVAMKSDSPQSTTSCVRVNPTALGEDISRI